MQSLVGLGLTVEEDEAAFLQYELTSADPIAVKTALQRLCAHLELGRHFQNAQAIRLSVIAHIWSKVDLIRRWSYKAIALLGLGVNSLDSLVHKITDETDFENSCWLLGAIAKLTRGENPRDICAKVGVEFNINYELSARIFATQQWMGDNPVSRHLNIDVEDPLTLKWASLLLGYGKAQDNLFHPRLLNVTVLQQLNNHDDPHVSEYSVWALWKAPLFGQSDLIIPPHEFMSRPAQVKRWINRLMMKDRGWVSTQPELLEQMISDEDVVAREGVALGLLGEPLSGVEQIIVPWYLAESEVRVKNTILEFMARSSDVTPSYINILQPTFRDAGANGTLRKRLITASIGTKLHNEFKKVQIVEDAVHANLDLFNTTYIGSIDMSNTTSIGQMGDINARNVSFGDMIDSANEVVKNIQNPDIASTLTEILTLLKSDGSLPKEQANAIVEAVKEVALNPAPETKSKLSSLIDAIKTGATITSAAGVAWKAIEATIQNWPF